jgi:hypothetical protein
MGIVGLFRHIKKRYEPQPVQVPQDENMELHLDLLGTYHALISSQEELVKDTRLSVPIK